MSVDTGGSELDVLQKLDFSKYKFGFIFVEHNFTAGISRMFELLGSNA